MKRLTLFCGIVIALSSAPNLATAGKAATPNVGFGSQTQGGLKGRIIKVTNLNDSGPGSLRAALEASGPRVIVFEVGGLIWLSRDLMVRNPYVTVAGETAPSPGITVANGGIYIASHDVVLRHVRNRVGNDPSGANLASRDGIIIAGTGRGEAIYNVVVDHCSVSWAVDENVSTWYQNVHDVTIRYSIIAEGLLKGVENSKGLLVGDHSQRVSAIGNLFANNRDRNPTLKGNTTSVLINNLIYNSGYWGVLLSDYEGRGRIQANVVNNLYRPGPSTSRSSPFTFAQRAPYGAQLYLAGNVSEDMLFRTNVAPDPRVSSWITGLNFPTTMLPANKVESFVLANAGARPKDRDAVDKRIVREVTTHGGKLINSQRDVGGWPRTGATYRALSLPANPQGDSNGNGRSNLEEWLDRYLVAVEGP